MSTKILKICPECKTFNENVDYCKHCGALIDLAKKREIARTKKALSSKSVEDSQENRLAQFFEKARTHRNFIIRWVAKGFYSVWVLGLAIAFVFGMIVLYLAA